MEVLIFDKDVSASRYAARMIAKLICEKPDAVLGLATGSTPRLLYAELCRQHEDEGLDFSGITSFNLDEYVGLDGSHPSSYAYFMQQVLFDHINVTPEGSAAMVILDSMNRLPPWHREHASRR